MTVYYITDFLYSLSSLTKDAQDSNLSLISKFINYNIYKMPYNDTLIPVYHCHKPVFRPKMAIFRRAGMREGGRVATPTSFSIFDFYDMKSL